MPKPVPHLPRIGSLFSGYGGPDLAVEHLIGGETIWFSELNETVARVFSHHWPDAPNLGDISTIDRSAVPSVDVHCGGFPCQDVSTVGKQAGLAPGTRSGLWSFIAAAIEALQPELVVIENVRGLLSTPAIRPQDKGTSDADHNPAHAISALATPGSLEPNSWMLGDESARPLRALGAVLGDLADLAWGDAEWIGLSASLVGAPHHRFRSMFGLSSAVWTHDPDEEEFFIDGLEAGAVVVNGISTSYPQLPFGGVKNSGVGRELSAAGIREFCNLKSVWRA